MFKVIGTYSETFVHNCFQTGGNSPVAPMITDTIRSHIQFGDSEMNGSPAHSPKTNGSASSTPSRGEPEPADHCESY